jgi:hypothetical protein
VNDATNPATATANTVGTAPWSRFMAHSPLVFGFVEVGWGRKRCRRDHRDVKAIT